MSSSHSTAKLDTDTFMPLQKYRLAATTTTDITAENINRYAHCITNVRSMAEVIEILAARAAAEGRRFGAA